MMRILNRVVLLLGVLLISGCLACEECGRINECVAVTHIFTSCEILQDHNYFYNGEILDPKAILAIKETFSLEGKFWTPIELSKEQLTDWVDAGKRRQGGGKGSIMYSGGYMGAEILDPQGEQVGFWYSRYNWGVFKFLGNNVIVAYPPELSAGSKKSFGESKK